MFKFIGRYWQKRRQRFYLKNRWHLVLDLSLGIIIILLFSTLIVFHYYNPFYKVNPIVPVQGQNEFDLNNPPLAFDFSLASPSLRLDEPVELRLIYKNDGKFEIKNISSDLVVVDKNYEIKKIELLDSKAELTNVKINNHHLNIPSLGVGETLVIPLKVYFSNRVKGQRYIKWQVQNEYQVQDHSVKEVFSLENLNVAAEVIASGAVYYNSPQGDQLGAGPLPPVVGLPTNYWVFFDVKSTGDFKDLVLTAKLSKQVELLSRRSVLAGEFNYNKTSKQVIWKIPEIDNQSDSYRVGFEVQFIPELNQLGRNAVLLSNIKFYATDVLINDVSYDVLPDLTSNLDFDRINKGDGEIAQP